MTFTVQTLAAKWSCSAKHIYELIESGKLKHFKIGETRGIRISDDEVKRWEGQEKDAKHTDPEMSSLAGQPAIGRRISRLAKLSNVRG